MWRSSFSINKLKRDGCYLVTKENPNSQSATAFKSVLLGFQSGNLMPRRVSAQTEIKTCLDWQPNYAIFTYQSTYPQSAIVEQVENMADQQNQFQRITDRNGVEKLLHENKVNEKWQNLIMNSTGLISALRAISHFLYENETEIAPNYQQVLRAFSFCNPEDVRVIIIGSSPITGKGIANGLSFSSDKMEDKLEEKGAIRKVHKALKRAGILDENKNYHCGHEEWAERGVLLLNAALTIPLNNDGRNEMNAHCYIWRGFLQGLLNEWLANTDIDHRVYVMLCGCEWDINPNFAEAVWSGINNVPDFITVLEAHHPTFSGYQENNFLEKASTHFRRVTRKHPGIFECKESKSTGSESTNDPLTGLMRNLALDNK